MIYLRELCKKLKINEKSFVNYYYRPQNNQITINELYKIKEILENKRTNSALIKVKKVERILINLKSIEL